MNSFLAKFTSILKTTILAHFIVIIMLFTFKKGKVPKSMRKAPEKSHYNYISGV